MDRMQYKGIDGFRLAAAVMVVAIHTAPFSVWSDTMNALLTCCAFRVAVPFFFMATGFFVFGPVLAGEEKGRERVKRFEWKHLRLYLSAILLYLPVNVYAGSLPANPGEAVKMLLFDGTFYHLWYFPAVMLGGLILLALLRLSIRCAAVCSGAAYLLGVLGDSWYGIAGEIPVLKPFYDLVFSVSSYTRNGIFFAPLFLFLGALAFRRRLSKKACLAGLAVSFPLMLLEGWLTYSWKLQRHNSMYGMLPVVMVFLFQLLCRGGLEKRKPNTEWMRSCSACVYLIHPAVIILLRGAAKWMGKTQQLIENSLAEFVLVCLISFGLSVVLTAVLPRILRKADQSLPPAKRGKGCKETGRPGETGGNIKTDPKNRAWVELDLKHLEQNVRQLEALLPKGCRLMPVVKADAYGHGAVLVSRALWKLGIRQFCVASAEEGAELRRAGIGGEILILGYTSPSCFSMLSDFDLTQTVIDYEYGRILQRFGKKLKVQIAVDTGMHRLGERSTEFSKILELWKFQNLEITGVFSHLCVSEGASEEERRFTEQQAADYDHLLQSLERAGITGFRTHLQASYGILNYSEFTYDLARAGIALYGCLSSPGDRIRCPVTLTPVLSLKARIACVRWLHPGEGVGYGLRYRAVGERKIAVVSIGYADGIPRELSGKGCALVRGRKAPIVGTICMDQLFLDVTNIREAAQGDEAVFIGQSGDACILAEEMARQAGTISNELLCRLGKRLGRMSVRGS